MKKILLMHQTITKHDAIGNDIELMYQILNEKYYCRCFAENKLNTNLKYVDENEAKKIINDKDGIVIYHHSVNWELGERMIENCKASLIFRYHNITPSEFFEPYNLNYYNSCRDGRIQTDRLIQNFPDAFWMSDSEYNTLDLKSVLAERLDVCPPFHKIEQWAQTAPDEDIMKRLIYDSCLKVLFVGRIAPNKGHLMMLDILNAYCINFDSNIKLYIIGKFDEGLNPYNQLIRNTIEKYRLHRNVEFVGEINDATLMAYYLGCDAFLCTSDHEGFCVPVIEAQKLRLPIVAKKSSAVPETLGQNQIILKDNVKEYAAAIHLLGTRQDVRNYLRENGISNFENRFTLQIISNIFKKIMYERAGIQL